MIAQAARPKGSIELRYYNVRVLAPREKSGTPTPYIIHLFPLEPGMKQYYMCSVSEHDRDAWAAALAVRGPHRELVEVDCGLATQRESFLRDDATRSEGSGNVQAMRASTHMGAG